MLIMASLCIRYMHKGQITFHAITIATIGIPSWIAAFFQKVPTLTGSNHNYKREVTHLGRGFGWTGMVKTTAAANDAVCYPSSSRMPVVPTLILYVTHQLVFPWLKISVWPIIWPERKFFIQNGGTKDVLSEHWCTERQSDKHLISRTVQWICFHPVGEMML